MRCGSRYVISRARRGMVVVIRLITRKRRSMIYLPILNKLYLHPSVPSSHKRQYDNLAAFCINGPRKIE